MSFNTGAVPVGVADDRNLFVPEETNRVELEREVISVGDAKVLCAVYTMIDEDHGVGQLLRHELQQDKRVSFAAYRIPHPGEAAMKLRFHVAPDIEPEQVLNDAINRCLTQIQTVSDALTKSHAPQ